MSKRAESGSGGVKAIRNRRGELMGYQAFLPRSLSRPPKDCARPETYQEPLPELYATREEARAMLDHLLPTFRSSSTMGRGPSVLDLVQAEIKARHHQARRQYPTEARANRAVATWRSIERNWLAEAPFASLPPSAVDQGAVQAWVRTLVDEGESERGEPLSASFIHQIARLLRASLARELVPTANPAVGIVLPAKSQPKVPFLPIDGQRAFFGAPSDQIPIEDRCMVGCGMGAGMRVGELLPFEPQDVHLDAADPHLLVRWGGAGHAPTKSRRVRRIELFEPGLGFWQLWMDRFYLGGELVFGGERGGYRKAWPENFPSWAKAAGVASLSSHIMRHTYAVAMLSGSWGYQPQSLEFVSQQLGHADLQTTERFYGAFEADVWRQQVRAMTGRVVEQRTPITAAELLGFEHAGEFAPPQATGTLDQSAAGVYPRHSPHESPRGAGYARGETPMNVSSRWCVTAVFALGALACSDPVPPPAQGAFIASIGPSPSPPLNTACNTSAFTYDVPKIRDTMLQDLLTESQYLHKTINGEKGAKVSCTVKGGANGFTFSGQILLGGRGLQITNGMLGPNKVGTASITVSNSERLSPAQLISPADAPCTINAAASGGNNLQAAPGNIWATFDCPQVNLPPTSSCGADGVFVFENCEQ